MGKREYAEYQASVAAFFADGLCNLSAKSDDNGTCEPYLSWRPCVCCGRSQGGDRYDCDGFNGRTREVEEYEGVCSDCVYYAEYGQLDDTTMASLTDGE